jgi:sugar phosphate isomerase/epimerase
MTISRRRFLNQSGLALASAAWLAHEKSLHASPWGQPLGFQAYEIIPDLNKDWDGTLKKMVAIGYNFIDALTSPPYISPTRTAKDLRAVFDSYGLGCDNAHFGYNNFKNSFAQTAAIVHDLKVKSAVCGPWNRRQTADDWKALADELNTFGAQSQKEGFFVGYHNHEIEFIKTPDGQVPYDILVTGTDPALVRFQIDVGNLTFGGADALAYLNKYPTRYYSLHAKDYVKGKASVPVGQGTLDWKKIFSAAKRDNIKSYVAEVGAYGASTLSGPLEPSSIDIIESFRQSYQFMKAFKNDDD